MTEWVLERVWRASDCLIDLVDELSEGEFDGTSSQVSVWPLDSYQRLLDVANAACETNIVWVSTAHTAGRRALSEQR